MEEKWIEYKNILIPKGTYEIVEVIQNFEGTKITLESDTCKATILFEFVDSIRMSDEGRRIKTYQESEGLQTYRESFNGNPIYIVENSLFNKWMIEESAGIYTDSTHYAIVTMNDIVDVLSYQEPIINVERT